MAIFNCGGCRWPFIVAIQMQSIVSNFATTINALVVPRITDINSSTAAVLSEWPHIEGLQLADPQYSEPGKIDLLIGVETYGLIIQTGLIKGRTEDPIAQHTQLGWILSGGSSHNNNRSDCFAISIEDIDSNNAIDDRVREMWEIEKLEEKPILSPADQRAIKLFNETTIIHPNGRFMVRLPFTCDPNSSDFLGESYNSAYVRLKSVLHKCQLNPQFKKDYEESINNSIAAGYLRPATAEEIKDTTHCYFMPHHAVVKTESTTTKTRVVFDASCRTTNGKSLNDRLLKGATLQDDLFTIILRWRQFFVAFLTDITKMYLQFLVHPDDAKFQRICTSTAKLHNSFLQL